MNTKAMDPNAKLSWLERIAYGIGDYAGNLVYSSISAFLRRSTRPIRCIKRTGFQCSS